MIRQYKRVLIVYSMDDPGTLRRLRAIRDNPFNSELTLGHFVPIYGGNAPFESKTGGPFIANDAIVNLTMPKGEESELLDRINPDSPNAVDSDFLVEELGRVVSEFNPDLIIVHSGVAYRTFTESFLIALAVISISNPDVSIVLEPFPIGFQNHSFPRNMGIIEPEKIFVSDDEVTDFAENVIRLVT